MWQTLRKNEVLKDLGTNEKEGLSEEEVKLRQEKNGKNKLQEKKERKHSNKIFKTIQRFYDYYFNNSINNISSCFKNAGRK